jgi:phosphoserine/homoserine phosphotransferase
VTLPDGTISGYTLRQKNGKREAVKALASLNMEIFAAGDSFNDLQMIREAKAGCLFRAPRAIREEYADIPCVDSYGELLERIDRFLAG